MSPSIIPFIETIHQQRKLGEPEEKVYKYFLHKIVDFITTYRIEAREIIVQDLILSTDENGLIDPSIPDYDINIWRWCAQAFQHHKDLRSAEKVIETCYYRMLELQLVNGKRYHKGTPLQTRGTILVDFGQYKRAKKYIILAHIEDIINGSPNAPAGQTLKLAGISESDLELILKEAQDHILLHADSPILFPEEIYQKIQYQIEYGSIGELSKQSVFTNPVYLKELWDRVEQSAETDDNAFKRRTLESLAQYLFSSIEGMYSKPSQIAGPYELDGIITIFS